jgi:tRNA threonylcarbamoyladenosine biosynthesis protein TsaE
MRVLGGTVDGIIFEAWNGYIHSGKSPRRPEFFIFWETFPDYKIYAFHGNMAAGKTSFIRALCTEKKVDDTVSSPTFSIINEYGYAGGRIYHLDLYRVKDEQEAIRAGVEDCLYSGDICLVEWPERAPHIFPNETLHVFFDTVDENTRKIRVPSLQ